MNDNKKKPEYDQFQNSTYSIEDLVDISNLESIFNKFSLITSYSVGFVEFDLSRFLVLPLRFSGVLVQEDFGWKFQQAQFEFDLDSSFTVMAILLLWILFGGSVLRFFYLLFKWLRAGSEN